MVNDNDLIESIFDFYTVLGATILLKDWAGPSYYKISHLSQRVVKVIKTLRIATACEETDADALKVAGLKKCIQLAADAEWYRATLGRKRAQTLNLAALSCRHLANNPPSLSSASFAFALPCLEVTHGEPYG